MHEEKKGTREKYNVISRGYEKKENTCTYQDFFFLHSTLVSRRKRAFREKFSHSYVAFMQKIHVFLLEEEFLAVDVFIHVYIGKTGKVSQLDDFFDVFVALR